MKTIRVFGVMAARIASTSVFKSRSGTTTGVAPLVRMANAVDEKSMCGVDRFIARTEIAASKETQKLVGTRAAKRCAAASRAVAAGDGFAQTRRPGRRDNARAHRRPALKASIAAGLDPAAFRSTTAWRAANLPVPCFRPARRLRCPRCPDVQSVQSPPYTFSNVDRNWGFRAH